MPGSIPYGPQILNSTFQHFLKFMSIFKDWLGNLFPNGGVESACATDSSGNITPLRMGQQTSANSQAIVIASDQSAVPIQNSATSFIGSITATGTIIPSFASNGYATANLQLSGTWSGTVALQISNDNTNWMSVGGLPASAGATNGVTSGLGSNGVTVFPIAGALFVRVQCTAYVSGTIVANLSGSSEGAAFPAVNTYTNIALLNNKTPSMLTAQSTGAGLGVASLASVSNADVASAARTTSANSGTIASDFGQAISGLVNVTAVSGTNPTIDIALQESFDNGTTWKDVYHVARITATGTMSVPNIYVSGRRRWAWTIGGTATPTFTFTITASQNSAGAGIVRSFYDRTIVPNTLSSTTAAFEAEGCQSVTMTISMSAITTGAIFGIQFSPDGANWADASATVTGIAGTVTVASTAGLQARYVRGIAKTAGTGETLTYAHFFGTN